MNGSSKTLITTSITTPTTTQFVANAIPFTIQDLSINNKSLRRKYERRTGDAKISIHWGQRKLLLNEIEFFTLYWDQKLIPKPLCVYAGAAPGIHITLLSQMFPAFTFHLYDPAEFKIKETPKIKIFNGLFTDDIAMI